MKLELLFGFLLVLAVTAELVTEDEDGKRIVGGYVSESGQYPFMALITNKGTHGKVCGGAIITDEWILTSATCVKDRSKENTSVKAGMVNASTTEETVEERDVISFHVHPQHDSNNPVVNDIALVRVAKFNYKQQLYNIPLAEPNSEYQGAAFTAGWGKSSEGQEGFDNTLKMAHVTVDSAEECETGLKEYCGQHTDNAVCQKLDLMAWDKIMCSLHAKISYESGPCSGDLGGALVRLLDQRDVCIGVNAEIVGECGKGISIYTKVSKYVDWINSVMHEDEEITGVLLENL